MQKSTLTSVVKSLKSAFCVSTAGPPTLETKFEPGTFSEILRHLRAMKDELVPIYLPLCLWYLIEIKDRSKIEDYIDLLNVQKKTDVSDESMEMSWGKNSFNEYVAVRKEAVRLGELCFQHFSSQQSEAILLWLSFVKDKNLFNEWTKMELLSAINYWKERSRS